MPKLANRIFADLAELEAVLTVELQVFRDQPAVLLAIDRLHLVTSGRGGFPLLSPYQ